MITEQDVYAQALEVCGASVYEHKRFGSYQGDWIAYVKFNDSKFFVHGTFGSCSVCDHFESEMSHSKWDVYSIAEALNGEDTYIWWEESSPRPLTETEKTELRGEVRTIGQRYLDDPLTYEQMIEQASRYIDWDADAEAMVEFIEQCIDRYGR